MSFAKNIKVLYNMPTKSTKTKMMNERLTLKDTL